MAGQVFRGGVPTEPEVALLRKEFDGRPKGEIITYQEIEAATGLKRGTTRHRTVVLRWRQEMEKLKGIQTRSIPGVGIEVMASATTLDVRAKDLHGLRRASGRLARRVDLIDARDLSDTDKSRRASLSVHAHSVNHALTDAARQVPFVLPSPLAPLVPPVKGA